MNVFFYGNFYAKLLSGKEYYFFHDNEKGICYKQKDAKEVEILLKDGNRDFSIDVDNNTIHLICSDTEGSLVYLCLEKDDKWSKYVILKNKNKKAIPENFTIHVINNWINVFYTLSHNNNTLLVHHIINNQNTSPKVIDYVTKNNLKYAVYPDKYNNIFLFYYSNNSPYKFGFRKYEWGKKKWSNFSSLLDNKIINPSLLIDKDLNFHITFLQKIESFVNLMYCKIKEPFNIPMDSPKLVQSNISSNNAPIILRIEENMHICWKSQTSIYTCSSEDNGDTWSKPAYFLCAPYTPMFFNYKSANTKGEEDFLKCTGCYGYANSKIYLHHISDYINNSKKLSTNKSAKNNSSDKDNPNTKITDTPAQNISAIDLQKVKISQTLLQNEINSVKKRIVELEKKLKYKENFTHTPEKDSFISKDNNISENFSGDNNEVEKNNTDGNDISNYDQEIDQDQLDDESK